MSGVMRFYEGILQKWDEELDGGMGVEANI